jgi:hypothetical protein
MICIDFRTVISRRVRRPAAVMSAAVMLAATGAATQAQPSEDPAAQLDRASASEAPRPWATGVSEAEQTIALEIYVAGNSEFAEAGGAVAIAGVVGLVINQPRVRIEPRPAVDLRSGAVGASVSMGWTF